MIDRRRVLALLGASSLAACSSPLEKPYVEKHFYLVEAKRAEALPAPSNGLTLITRSFQVSPTYQDRGLITKTDDLSVKSDFYSQFFVSPGAMIEQSAAGWLARAGLFETVASGVSRLPPTHALEGVVSAIYGDMPHSKAVIELQLIAIDVRSADNKIIARGDYTQAEPVPDTQPASLVAGWDRALATILADFEAKLRQGLQAT